MDSANPDGSPAEQADAVLVSVARVGPAFGLMRVLHVRVDGQGGKLGYGDELEFKLPPGRHRIQVWMDWCRTEAEFEVEPDNECQVEVSVGRWALFKTFFAPSRLFEIRSGS